MYDTAFYLHIPMLIFHSLYGCSFFFLLLNLFSFYFIDIGVLTACRCEGLRSPGTGIIDSCELPFELPGPLKSSQG